MKSFNLNDYIYIKITAKGREIFFHQHDKVNEFYKSIAIEPSYPEVNGDGYTKMQAWEVMKLFGEYLGNGMNLPIETEILIDGINIKEK